ncbi:MAG: dephospho-CoA kinase [Phycisphaeraceae bacterium]
MAIQMPVGREIQIPMSDQHIPPVIGLMGPPGSGKSLVARQMASLGCVVIDSDAIAKRVLDRPETREKLVEWWGESMLGPDGRVNRRAVADRVFSDPEALKQLEGLIHPQVHAERKSQRAEAMARSGVRAIVEDSPLLLESGIAQECDVIVLVDAPFDLRLERVSRTRGWDRAELERREKNQAPLDIKRECADYVIINDADEAHCLTQTRRVLSQITP